MKILFVDWWTYTVEDVCDGFARINVDVDLFQYKFEDKNHDELFESELTKRIYEGSYDFVYSTNYFPVIAEVCYRCNILYLSWSYDNPLNVINIEETLGFSTNRVFLFDRVQVETYRGMGFDHIYHLPLAVNAHRLDKIQLNSVTDCKYVCDVAFVGKLYPPLLQEYQVGMTDYQKGYTQSICDIQQQLYGYYIVDQLISEELIDSINHNYEMLRGDKAVVFNKEALSYGISCQATRNERLILLSLLSRKFNLNVYSNENCGLLSDSKYMGQVNYYKEMPLAFKGGKINLNINLKISQSGIPLRVMDILGCRGFLISSYQPEVAEYFENEKEIILYDGIEDAYEKVEWFLKHDDIRESIAKAGYERVKSEFSYEKQLTQMIKIAGV